MIVWMTKREGSNAWVVTGYEKRPDGRAAGRATDRPTHAAASRTRDDVGAGNSNNGRDNGQINRSVTETPVNPDDARYSIRPSKAFSVLPDDTALADATKALNETPQYKPDFIGQLQQDIGRIAKFILHPRQIAVLHKDFTPAYTTAIDQFAMRDSIIDELQQDHQAYDVLPQASKARINAVLELGRLLSTTYDEVLGYADVDQEHWCCIVLERGLEPDEFGLYDDAEVAERFKAHPERLPHTLADCLHELDYWNDLWRLRRASPESPGAYTYEGPGEASARRFFIEGLLAEIRPRNRDEAKAVLRHVTAHQRLDGAKGDAILENLIG